VAVDGRGQHLGRVATPAGDVGGHPVQVLLRLGDATVEGLRVGVSGLELGESRAGFVGVRQDGGDVRAVLAGERVQDRATVLELGEPCGIRVDGVAVAADVDGQLGGLGGDGDGAVGQFGQDGVVHGGTPERRDGDAEGFAGTVGADGRGDLVGEAAQLVRVGEHLEVAVELVVALGVQLRRVDLRDLGSEPIELAGTLALVGRELVAPVDQVPPALVGLPVARQGASVRVTRRAIEQPPLHVRPCQPDVFVLRVDLHVATEHVGEGRHGGQGAADPRAAAALGPQLPGDHQLVRVRVDPPAGVLGHGPDHGADGGRRRARTDQRTVGPGPQQELERGHDHRLAGTRLPRDDGQTRCELERRVLDDAEAGDGQLLEHDGFLDGSTDGVARLPSVDARPAAPSPRGAAAQFEVTGGRTCGARASGSRSPRPGRAGRGDHRRVR
jgi:hypothetical protein